MALALVTKGNTAADREPVRVLGLKVSEAIRAVKARDADEDERALYIRVLRHVRANDLWLLCDCRDEEDEERPVIVPRRVGHEDFRLANLPDPEVAHAEGCVFGPVADEDDEGKPASGGRAPRPVHDDRLDPFAPADRPEDEDRVMPTMPPRRIMGVSRGPRHRKLGGMLRLLMQTARLNRLDDIEALSPPRDGLAEIARAAEQFTIADGMPASAFLFTDPASWTEGEVVRRLEAAEPDWPRKAKPFAMLCWPALSMSDHAINPEHRYAGHVGVVSEVTHLAVGSNRISGPWLFLGIVARPPEGGRWACLQAFAQPVIAQEYPLPVDSHQERRAFAVLRSRVRQLERDPRLQQALGGPVRVELEKPLTTFLTEPESCLPDFLITVTPPGIEVGAAAGRRDGLARTRYIVEVMGFEDARYETRKARTHAAMRRLARLFRMDSRQFDNHFNHIHRQADRIAGDIANDLIRRWGAARPA